MRNVVFYHYPCMDGFTSAYAVWKALGSEGMEYIPITYGDPFDPGNYEDCRVLMVDFSFKKDVMEKLLDNGNEITILDHHKSAVEEISSLLAAGHIDGEFDLRRSGCGITWDHFHGQETRTPLINLMEDRDLWNFHYPDTENIYEYVSLQPRTFSSWDLVNKNLQEGSEYYKEACKIGYFIRKKKEADIQEWISKGIMWCWFSWDSDVIVPLGKEREKEKDGWVIPVINCPPTHGSDAAHRLLMTFSDVPFAGYFWDIGGKYSWGLRSSDERIDVSKVAQLRGGGGHRNASGFRVDY